jgi:hypothetical protein
MVRPAWCAAIFVVLAYCHTADARGPAKGPALHEQVDRLVEAAAVGPLAPPCSDADFVRRAYLDLTGIIPTAEQAKAFLDDAPDKRAKLIDALLATPEFLRHMTITLDVMFMERRTDKAVKQTEWERFLLQSLADDKPLDQLCSELIAADGASEDLRPAARFVLDREAEPNLITRDVGRLMFGMDLQCAQCHDHPLIDDYYQHDYYGLFAFVHRTSLFTDAKTKQVSLGEKADGEASFKSVFTGDGSDRATPQLPKGGTLLVEPAFASGEEYLVKPEKNVRGVPKFSRRQALAEMVADSREFRRNLANRLWATMLGRGLVHPMDFHHAGNPPVHPAVLTLLADELERGGFRLRPIIRELALTRVYQRSCEPPQPETVNFADVAARLEQLSRQKEDSDSGLPPLKDAVAKAKTEFTTVREQDAKLAAELPKLQQAIARAQQSLDKAHAERKTADEAVAKAREHAQAVAEAAAKVSEAIAGLAPDKVLADASETIVARARELAAEADELERSAEECGNRERAAADRLAAEQAAYAKASESRVTRQRLSELEQTSLAASHALSEAEYQVAAIESQIAAAKAIVEYAGLARTDPAKAEAAWSALVERWTIAGQLAMLKPLSPEQFAASAMQATGMFAPQVASAEAKLDKSPPESLKAASEADKPRVRSQLVEAELLARLRGIGSEFVKQYGGLPGQDFQATVNQALFFGNGGAIDGWLKPFRENLVVRLSKLEDTRALADEMYLAVLSRAASDTETDAVAAFLEPRAGDRAAAIGEMVWALLSSSEFRFNH